MRRLEVVLGKFLAAFGLLLLLLVITGLYVGLVAHYSRLGLKPVSAGFLGLGMLGAAFLALGLFISSLTRNQIVAAVGTFSLFLLLWVADWVTSYGSGHIAALFSYLSITSHFRNFAQGVLDTKDIVYYLSLIVGGLFLTARRMELAE